MAHLTHTSMGDHSHGSDSHPDTRWIAHADAAEASGLLAGISALTPFASESTGEKLAGQALMQLAWRSAKVSADPLLPIDPETRDELFHLYRRMGNDSTSRHHLLSILAHGGTADDLRCFAELISSDPPSTSAAAATVFFPLTGRSGFDVSALFPRLLDGLQHVQVAAAILDLASFLTRRQMTSQHPAAEHKESLTKLLGTVVGQLSRWEDNPPNDVDTWQRARDQVNEGIALAVSLCDTLSFIGDSSSIGKLNQAVELGHRRVRVEAAAALSRLGDERGTTELVRLASEPITRLRVLAYAEELDISSKIDPQFMTEQARAEAELACFLAEPTQFGIPPQHIKLVDQRNQYWPGYEEPLECYLFRYEFQLPQGQYSNIGIAGPLVHALTADLADLPMENIYAAYAGGQAEHEEILELELDQLSRQQQGDCRHLRQLIEDAGYDQIEASMLGIFFGEPVLMATASKDHCPGTVVADRLNLYWYPHGSKTRPLSAADAYAIYKGRNMLEMFNS